MKKLLVAVCVMLCAPFAQAQKNKLNVFIWSEYMDPEIIADFEKQFDCKVTMDLYEDNESMMAKLQSGGDALYDLCVPSNYIIPALIHLGLVAKLRHENIPNLKNLGPKFANPVYDPGNKYSAAYQWGTVGIFIRKSGDKPVDETWGLLFDPAKQPGPFLMMDSIREMIGSGLRYKGYGVNSTNPEELKAVRDMMLEAKKRSLGFEGGVGGKNKVLSKTCAAAVVYNGDAVRGMSEDADTYYFVPREGGIIWMDNMCIPAKAPHRDLAEKFINFILDANVGARLSNFNQYATPNAASMEFINPDDRANAAIYPSADTMTGLEFVNDVGNASQLYDEVWTQVKSD